MSIEIGQVEAILRYPVKSMAAERLGFASLGWHGIDGDRRLAFRRVNDHSGMPWLTAGKLPDLLLFTPQSRQDGVQERKNLSAGPANKALRLRLGAGSLAFRLPPEQTGSRKRRTQCTP